MRKQVVVEKFECCCADLNTQRNLKGVAGCFSARWAARIHFPDRLPLLKFRAEQGAKADESDPFGTGASIVAAVAVLFTALDLTITDSHRAA